MRKFLLLFLAVVCVQISAWAGPAEMNKDNIGHWFINTVSGSVENVIYIKVKNSDQLKNTLNDLNQIISATSVNDLPEAPAHLREYYQALDTGSEFGTPYTNLIANKKLILKVVFEKGNGPDDPETLELSNDALTALANIDVPTIDLQDSKISNESFALNNRYVRNLILPDGFNKQQVATAVTGCTNLGSAFSQGATSPGVTEGCSVVAYVNKPGTLFDAIRRSGYLNHNNDKMGSVNPTTFSVTKIEEIAYLGNPSSRDFASGGSSTKFGPDGHFVFNVEADETATNENQAIAFAGIGGVERVTQGDAIDGALNGATLVSLDLGDAIIYEDYCNDLTLSRCNVLNDDTKQVVFPTTSELKTIPADCLMCSLKSLEEICIPGNIEYIRTRAFCSSDQVLKHIWTTSTKTLAEGEVDHTIYDNGTYLVSNPEEIDHYGQAPFTDTNWNCRKSLDEVGRYGTITLPANLKLIESHAFSCRGVSDVYVLAVEAPECHVDAFSSIMYLGNNTIDKNGVQGGMIDRWAYAQSRAKGEYISFLHYPRESGTPNIQRYTDPTREYSVATTLRDGKGNIIYFPNQSELNRAFLQGTTGYLWDAWDSERTPSTDPGNPNAFVNGPLQGYKSHTDAAQQEANRLYNENTMTDPDKTDRTFYDVRLGENGQPIFEKPSDLQWYYEQYRSGHQLYPKPETVGVVDEQGNPVMETVPVYDENGEIEYDELPSGSSYEGNYTRATVQRYVKADNGTLCHQLNQDGNGEWTLDYAYTPNATGAYCKAPWDATGKTWTTWDSWMGDIPRYDRSVSGLIKFDNQKHNDGRPRFNISDDYVEYDSYNNEYKNLLTRYNLVDAYVYSPAQSGDPEPYYKMRTQVVQEQKVTAQHDYRGWHQFILHAYATNDDRPFTPVKFYQTDNDWWTVCLPYDLKYNDMMRFFGNGEGNKPYLSKLRYVVRDYDQKKITLMFSKNLMVYKEVITNPSEMDDYVHGVIDDKTPYSPEELAENPIILHKGVPYLIRPNIPSDYNGSFDVYKNDHENADPDLYQRLIDAENVDGGTLETYIYKGEYTVPAYVVGASIPETTTTSRSFNHAAGPTMTYTSSDKITYGGKEIQAQVSNDFCYTFVGSFFLSPLPQYCYFLGWDSQKNRAAFWYNETPNLTSYDWNNQTGVICPNFNTSLQIDPATSLSDPAKWTFRASDISSDDLVGSTSGAKAYSMDWGGMIDVVVNGIGTIESLSSKATSSEQIYDLQGVRKNQPLNNLQKGVYIVNGKKYVVK